MKKIFYTSLILIMVTILSFAYVYFEARRSVTQFASYYSSFVRFESIEFSDKDIIFWFMIEHDLNKVAWSLSLWDVDKFKSMMAKRY